MISYRSVLTGVVLSICSILPGILAAAAGEEPSVKLSLEQAIETALLHNLNIRLSRDNLEFAKGGTIEEQGTFDTFLEAGAARGEYRYSPTVVTGGPFDEDNSSWSVSIGKSLITGTKLETIWSNSYADTESGYFMVNPMYTSGVDVKISQHLLKGRGQEVQTAGIRSADNRVASAAFLVSREAVELTSQVRKAYWGLVSSLQDMDVLHLSLDLAKQLEKETAGKIESGMLADMEIYQPQSEVARREQNLIVGERAVGTAQDNLRFLMGNREWDRYLYPVDRVTVTENIPHLEDIMDRALANRPDILAASRETAAAEMDLLSLENKILPALDVYGSMGLAAHDDGYGAAMGDVLDEGDSRWQVGLVFSMPIENRGAEGRYIKARARLNQARTREELLRQETRSLVRQAYRDLGLSVKGIEATTKTSLASQKRLEAEQTKFKVGRATTYDVLVAQEAYAKAVSEEYRAMIVYAQSLAELDRVQGLVSVAR